MAASHGGGDLIAAIYDAIIEPSGWDEVVKRWIPMATWHHGTKHADSNNCLHSPPIDGYNVTRSARMGCQTGKYRLK